MITDEWVPVLDEKVLDENLGECVAPKGQPVLLMKRYGQIFALSNRCPHMGCTLGGGSMEGYILTCPCHDWRFDIRTGNMVDGNDNIVLRSYECRVDSGKISIRIKGE